MSESSNTAALVEWAKFLDGYNGAGADKIIRNALREVADALSALAKELEEARGLIAEYRDHSQPYWEARAEASERQRDEALAALKASEAREAEMRAALERLMRQPTQHPLKLSSAERTELWAAHGEARAVLSTKEMRS